MKMSKTAKITVWNNSFSSREIVKEYTLPFENPKQLHADYQEARQVWSEYHVVCETEAFELSSSHTFREEFLLGLTEYDTIQ